MNRTLAMKEVPKLTYVSAEDHTFRKCVINIIEILFGRRSLQRLYRQAVENCDIFGTTFWESALSALDIHVQCNNEELSNIPKEGPLILVANHPYGVVDGLIACHIAEGIRPDFKILINNVLCSEKRLESYILPIDFDDNHEAKMMNIESRKVAKEILKNNGALMIFPAGGVATAESLFGPAIDLEWRPFVTKLIQQHKATVVPMYFYGQNSRLFQVVSQFSYTLRLALLLHEVRNKIGKTIQLKIGQPIRYQQLPNLKRNELTYYLRKATHLLAKA